MSYVKAQLIVEAHARVVDGKYEMPVLLKGNSISLPDNFPLAAKRAEGLYRRMLKNPEHLQALVESMQVLQENKYIVPANENAASQVNYLPYFLTSQTKPRVVYDGAATFQGRSIKDLIYSVLDLLNLLPQILAKFRLGKYALIPDITKCFFPVLILKYPQNLFQILWYKDNDVQRGKLQPYKFTRYVWGIISSPYIACHAIRRTAEENPTVASDLTTDTIRNCMYMDDLLYSTDTLEQAQLIAKEAIQLLVGRGFDLVKWSANNHAKSILSELDEGKLAPSIRTLKHYDG